MEMNSRYIEARPGNLGLEPKVLIVLPAYNEEDSLPPLLARFEESLAAVGSHGILVVDDGSADATASVAEAASGTLPVTVIRHASNRGLGAALQTGLVAALGEADIVVTMDADDSHDPATIPLLINRLQEGYDIVIASRFEDGGQEVGVAAHRRLLSHSASAILGIVVGVEGAKDYSCGFRAYRSTFLRRLIQDVGEENLVRETGFACMVELLLKASAHGARVAEVPLVLRYDRKQSVSKIRVFRTIVRYGVVLSRHFTSGGWLSSRRGSGYRYVAKPARHHGVG
jgi:dolichol-phosphate mannosyltransferase